MRDYARVHGTGPIYSPKNSLGVMSTRRHRCLGSGSFTRILLVFLFNGRKQTVRYIDILLSTVRTCRCILWLGLNTKFSVSRPLPALDSTGFLNRSDFLQWCRQELTILKLLLFFLGKYFLFLPFKHPFQIVTNLFLFVFQGWSVYVPSKKFGEVEKAQYRDVVAQFGHLPLRSTFLYK